MKYALLFDKIGKRICLFSALFLAVALYVPPYVADVKYAEPGPFLTHFSWSYENYTHFIILFSAAAIYWNFKDKRERVLIISVAQMISVILVINLTAMQRYLFYMDIPQKVASQKFTPYYGQYLLQIGAIGLLTGAVLRENYERRVKLLLKEENEAGDDI